MSVCTEMPGLHRDAHRDAGVVAECQLLEEHRVVRVVEPLAPVLRIVANAQQAQLTEPPENGLVRPSHLVELARARHQLGLHELPHHRAKGLVLGAAVHLEIRHARISPSGALAACAIVQDGECSTRAAGRGG
jgi:hypothetical protein